MNMVGFSKDGPLYADSSSYITTTVPSITVVAMLVIFLVCYILHLGLAELLNTARCGVNYRIEGLVKDEVSSHVFGGDIAGPGLWPWACSVGFLNTSWEHQCGGALGKLSE